MKKPAPPRNRLKFPTTKTEQKDGGVYTDRRLARNVFQATYEGDPTTIAIATARARIRVCEMCVAAGYSHLRETEAMPPYRVLKPRRLSVGDPASHSHMEAPHQIKSFTARGRRSWRTGYLSCSVYMESLRKIAALPVMV